MYMTHEHYRASGLHDPRTIPWGTHICQFYQNKHDLLSVLTPYFKAGLENNEYCFWITSAILSPEEAQDALRQAVPDFQSYLDKGQIVLTSYQDWYLKGGRFDMDRVLGDWLNRLEFGLSRGFEGLRVTGDTAWLEEADWENFSQYERRVNESLDGQKMLAICSYHLDRCRPHDLIEVVQSHQFALVKKENRWINIESSERRRAEAELRKAYAELEARVCERTRDLVQANTELMRLNELKSEFISTVSHELRTPLSAISESVQIVQDGIDGPVTDEQKNTLELCKRNIDRLSRLIESVLDFGKLDSGDGSLKLEPTSLGDLLTELHDFMAPMMAKKGLTFTLDLPPSPITLIVDSDKIKQVLINILDNAWKYTNAGSVRLSLATRTDGADIVVEDTGCGIAAEELPHIFDAFYRGRKTRQSQVTGAGLGLALCRQIMTLHHGHLSAESAPDRGTRFIISFRHQARALKSA